MVRGNHPQATHRYKKWHLQASPSRLYRNDCNGGRLLPATRAIVGNRPHCWLHRTPDQQDARRKQAALR